MKRNGSHLRQYLPWLGLLLGVDALAVLLLWLADARAFAAMTAVIVLATVFLFAGVCAVLCARSKRREQAFTALYYRVVVIRAPLQGLCYNVRDAVDWFSRPTARRFQKGSNHSPLQYC